MDNSIDVIVDNSQLEKLKERIIYDENVHKTVEYYEQILNDLLEDSKTIGLSLRFPYFKDYSKLELPEKYYNWQIRCCVELYKLAGNENIKSYSENGLNWEMFRNGLSLDLRNEIRPKVGVPIEDDEDVSNE